MIRYQHIRFCKLNVGEDFFYRRQRYTKTSYLLGLAEIDATAQAIQSELDNRRRRAPDDFVEAPKPGGKAVAT